MPAISYDEAGRGCSSPGVLVRASTQTNEILDRVLSWMCRPLGRVFPHHRHGPWGHADSVERSFVWFHWLGPQRARSSGQEGSLRQEQTRTSTKNTQTAFLHTRVRL